MLSKLKTMMTVAVFAATAAGIGLATSAASGAAEGGQIKNGGPAPEFTGIDKWLNSDPLTIKQLRGKVVLVDFWTYTCSNCINTLSYVKGWDQK